MNEVSKNLVCVSVRNGVQIWIEKERAENLIVTIGTLKESKFVNFESAVINTADIVGIFTPQQMEEVTRRKNGEWMCHRKVWHERFKKCGCEVKSPSEMSESELRRRVQG